MLDNNILDEKEGEEVKGIPPQPLISMAWMIICIYAISLIALRTLIVDWTNFDLLQWLVLLIFVFIKGGFVIYYNLIHAVEESRGIDVKPKFSRSIIGLFIIMLTWQGAGFICRFFIRLDFDFYAQRLWESLLLSICVMIILVREKDIIIGGNGHSVNY